MSDINTSFIEGRLTRDAELRFTPSGTAILDFSLANNRQYMVGDEKKEEVSYFDCVIFGSRAQGLSEHLTKGRKLWIKGRLKHERWEKEVNGEMKKRSKIVIVVDDLSFASNGQAAEKKAAEEAKPEEAKPEKATA